MSHKLVQQIGMALLLCLLSPLAWAETVTYTYDNLHRLIKVEYDDGTVIEYAYDAVGNRISLVVRVSISDAIKQLRVDTFAAQIPGPRGKSLVKSLDKALGAMAKGEARLANGDIRGAKNNFTKALRQIGKYSKILTLLVKKGKVLPEVASPLLTAANAIIAQINALIAGL